MTPMNWGSFGSVAAGFTPVSCTAPAFTNLRIFSIRPLPATHGNILSTFSVFSRESFEVTVSGGSTFARVKLKEIDGMAPQDVERAV